MTEPANVHKDSACMQKVSVCLAAYNGAKFVTRQLQSIAEQLRPGDEIIVVDDASSDETAAIVESIADPRIRVIRRPTNGGVATTFLDALTLASGEVIFLADQDDFWIPGKVEAVLARIEAGNDLVVHDAVVVKDGLVILPSLFAERRSGPGVLRNIFRNSYTGCCLAFRRSILEDLLPFPESDLFFHDNWIGLAAELSSLEIEFLRRPLIEYTRHAANVTARRPLGIAVWARFVLAWEVAKFVVRRATRRAQVR